MKTLRAVSLLCIPCGFLSLFLFPWPLTAVLAVGASFAFPLAALALGLAADALYYPGTGIPYATLLGLAVMVFSYFVQQFAKRNIL